MKIFRLLAFLSLCLSSIGAAGAAPLSFDQVAQHAYDAGFRGGGLVTAVAVADAESGRDPDAVSNNYALLDIFEAPLLAANGKQRVEGVPASGAASLAPLDGVNVWLPSLDALGRPVSHCIGLWQLNDQMYFGKRGKVGSAENFNPSVTAQKLWHTVTNEGLNWYRFISVMRGTPWEESRWRDARKAASRLDPEVLPENPGAQRVKVITNYANVWKTPGGTIKRKTRKGDSGLLLEGPRVLEIRDGDHRSRQPMCRIAWDWGDEGWVSESYLAQADPAAPTSATPASAPEPRTGIRCIGPDVGFNWNRGANVASQVLRVATSPSDLDRPSAVRTTTTLDTTATLTGLALSTTYYWRVDSIAADGVPVPGPVWNFYTQALDVTLANLSVSHTVWPASRRVTVSGRILSPEAQRVVIGLTYDYRDAAGDYHSLNDAARETGMTTGSGNTPVDFQREFELPAGLEPYGDGSFRIAIWRDWDGNGKVTNTDQQISYFGSLGGRAYRIAQVPGGVRYQDLIQPVISGFTATPAEQTTATLQPVTLSATVRDFQTSIVSVHASYSLPRQPEVAIGPLTVSTGDVWARQFQLPPGAATYTFLLRATDAHGNLTIAHSVVNVSDRSPPVLSVTQPVNGGTVQPGGLISGTATDHSNFSLEYRIDGGPWLSPTGTLWWDFPAPTVPGPHLLEMRASDFFENTSPILTHYFYVPGDPLSPDTFDEFLPFTTSSTPLHWMLDTDDPNFAGLLGNGLEAASNTTTSLRRPKPVPAWVHTVELSCEVHRSGGWRWEDSSGRTWIARIRPADAGNGSVAELGDAVVPAVQSFTSPGRTNLRVLISQGHMTLRVWRGLTTFAELSAPGLTLQLPPLTELTGHTEGTAEGGGTMDELRIRGLRVENLYQLHAPQPGPQAGEWQLSWSSFTGRRYRLETSADLSLPWMYYNEMTATGIHTVETFIAPNPPASRRFWRVVETTP